MSLYSDWMRKRKVEEEIFNSQEQERHNKLKLSEWLESKKAEEPAIFVDQDETILYIETAGYLPHKGEYAVKNAVFKNIMGHEMGIIIRPKAADFLKQCRSIAPTYILTAGTTSFQERVLETVGLLSLVKDVYGRDRYQDVPKGRKGILIDNLPHNSHNSSAKLMAMGGGMYLKVPDWSGTDPKDNVLMAILPQIKKAFSVA
jgi:hypothetical protein